MPVVNADKLIEALVGQLRVFVEYGGVEKFTVAVSGGVDSAVMLALATRAVGPENVQAVYIDVDSSEVSALNAQAVADNQGVSLLRVNASNTFADLSQQVKAGYTAKHEPSAILEKRLAKDLSINGSFRSCIRAPIARYLNRLSGKNSRLLGTGNECEDRLFRYFCKGGDGEVDCNIASHLSKGEMRQLALALGIPVHVVLAKPTHDLWGKEESPSDAEELTASSDGVVWNNSTVNENGKYTHVGTTERMSRFVDYYAAHFFDSRDRGDQSLMARHTYSSVKDVEYYLGRYLTRFGLTAEHVFSALKHERDTRHKQNKQLHEGPERSALIRAGCLTDNLPLDLMPDTYRHEQE